MPRATAERICLIGPTSTRGDSGPHLEALARRLASEGVSVWLLSYDSKLPGFLEHVEDIPGVRTVCSIVSYLAAVLGVMRKIDGFYQMVDSGSRVYASALILFSRCFRKRIVLGCLPGSWTTPPKRNEHWLRWADQVVVPSLEMKQFFEVAGIETQMVPNTVDADFFGYIGRGILRPKFLVTRPLEQQHSVDSVLRAFGKVQAVCRNAELAIAGAGPESQRLKKLARCLRLRNVRFLGFVKYEELPALYGRYDIFVNPSRDESFPRAIIEAACCGLPIVTTEVPSVVEMMRSGCKAISVPVEDEIALTGAMLEALIRQHYALDLAYNARKWVEQFDPAVSLDGLKRVLFSRSEPEPGPTDPTLADEVATR